MPTSMHCSAPLAAAVLLALGPALAAAQPVYRCVVADRVAFQDTACAGAETIDPLAREPLPAGAVPDAVKALVERYETRSGGAREGRTVRASAPARRARADSRPAYRCTAPDGRSTYSSQPCRAPRAKEGERPVPIEQQLVTQREACEGRHAELDPYEREKRGPPACGPR